MPEKKPNILLLINDEHRPDVMPIEGNPHIRTPTLDRFIDQGTYFRNAYTPSPICVPARQSFLSGLYPHNTGALDNDNEMPSEVATIPGHPLALWLPSGWRGQDALSGSRPDARLA